MSDELEFARDHCFMAGVGDTGAALCEANVPYGLAKIHAVQRALGVAPDAVFVGAPDATVTRNAGRWGQGFGYGGVYAWTGDFTVLDIKANACGVLVGALPSLPALEEVRARLRALDHAHLELDGVTIENDLTEGNHFVDVCTVTGGSEDAPGGARHLFLMHSSGHEHREETAFGPGIYWDASAPLRARARVIDTPWGSAHVLDGSALADWYPYYQRVQAFNHRRREALAQFLFDAYTPVVNETHQGLVRAHNIANIGAYTFADPADDGASALYPLALSPTLPAYLVRGRKNFTAAQRDALGWRPRVERLGVEALVSSINLLPHGGGYVYPQIKGVARVIEDGPDQRRFELIPADPAIPVPTIASPKELPHRYRGMEVKERMEALGLGTAVVAMDIEYVVTA
jgi:hypothetical protein